MGLDDLKESLRLGLQRLGIYINRLKSPQSIRRDETTRQYQIFEERNPGGYSITYQGYGTSTVPNDERGFGKDRFGAAVDQSILATHPSAITATAGKVEQPREQARMNADA